MKEFLKVNYNINISKIFNDYFYYDGEKIKIIKYEDDIKKINDFKEIINIINDKRISEFIVNKNNEILTKYKDKNILLIKINDLDEQIDYEYYKIFNKNINILEDKNIISDWEKQIDELEIDINDKYKDYYIGLAEIALSLLYENNINVNKIIGHDLKFNKINKEELNNPLNFKKIDKFYDISNYIKKCFFENKLKKEEIEKVKNEITNINEKNRFIAYMIYPNYYFETEKKEKIIEKHVKYKALLESLK